MYVNIEELCELRGKYTRLLKKRKVLEETIDNNTFICVLLGDFLFVFVWKVVDT